jgi:hypothetical protein
VALDAPAEEDETVIDLEYSWRPMIMVFGGVGAWKGAPDLGKC